MEWLREFASLHQNYGSVIVSLELFAIFIIVRELLQRNWPETNIGDLFNTPQRVASPQEEIDSFLESDDYQPRSRFGEILQQEYFRRRG